MVNRSGLRLPTSDLDEGLSKPGGHRGAVFPPDDVGHPGFEDDWFSFERISTPTLLGLSASPMLRIWYGMRVALPPDSPAIAISGVSPITSWTRIALDDASGLMFQTPTATFAAISS